MKKKKQGPTETLANLEGAERCYGSILKTQRRSNTTKIALQASGQERRAISPKKKSSDRPQLKNFSCRMMIFAKQSRPEAHSIAFNEKSKTIIERK